MSRAHARINCGLCEKCAAKERNKRIDEMIAEDKRRSKSLDAFNRRNLLDGKY